MTALTVILILLAIAIVAVAVIVLKRRSGGRVLIASPSSRTSSGKHSSGQGTP